MILAFYGSGKGKTTSAVGTLLRSLNLDKRVVLIQLYKNVNNMKSNELEFLKKLKLSNFTLMQFGKEKGWVNFKKPSNEDTKLTKKAVRAVSTIIKKNQADVLVIDEILLSHYYGLCSKEDILNIIQSCNENKIDLILTGRKMRKSLLEHMDLVTEMKSIKHPFEKKIPAKEGIDF